MNRMYAPPKKKLNKRWVWIVHQLKKNEVKNKSWFGILNVVVLMLADWAILRESAIAIMEESNGSDTRINRF